MMPHVGAMEIELAKEQLHEGNEAFRRRDIKAASTSYRKVITCLQTCAESKTQNKFLSSAVSNLAIIEFAEGRYAAARMMFEKVLELRNKILTDDLLHASICDESEVSTPTSAKSEKDSTVHSLLVDDDMSSIMSIFSLPSAVYEQQPKCHSLTNSDRSVYNCSEFLNDFGFYGIESLRLSLEQDKVTI